MQACDEVALERLLVAPERPHAQVQPDFGRIHQELRRKGMTLQLLWEEYRAEHSDSQTYGYSQFCDNYRCFAKRLKRSMRQVHRGGEKLFIDFAGPTVPLTDGARVHIFVSAMGASSYTFAWATPKEMMVDWIESTVPALHFYGGVTQLIVPDNARAMIADPNRYEPRSNDTVLDFARHYGTSVLPARPYSPQDKSKAESAVQVVERWILARLRHQRFNAVEEVNAAIAPLLDQLNERAFQKLPGSRTSAFAALDAPALLPLPAQRYEIASFKTVKVHIDYHVEVDSHYYSVPHALIGRALEARITTLVVAAPASRPARCQPCPVEPARALHHGGRAHAGGAPRACPVDAAAPAALGPEHRRGHGGHGVAPARSAATSRARLPRLAWVCCRWPSATANRG